MANLRGQQLTVLSFKSAISNICFQKSKLSINSNYNYLFVDVGMLRFCIANSNVLPKYISIIFYALHKCLSWFIILSFSVSISILREILLVFYLPSLIIYSQVMSYRRCCCCQTLHQSKFWCNRYQSGRSTVPGAVKFMNAHVCIYLLQFQTFL